MPTTTSSQTARPTVADREVWRPQRKTAEEGEAVKAVYERFAAMHDIQKKKFKEQVLDKMPQAEKDRMTTAMQQLGLKLDSETCHVSYAPDFTPLKLDYDLCYVRHGKTEGNTEPRIYQGFCDYWENQLNETGKRQALEAAAKMEQTLPQFTPDLILCSPLGRAIETGEAFFKNHREIPCRVHYGAREQQFGVWDNMQLRWMPEDDICHLFYLDQNVLVKAPAPHRGGDGKLYAAECFIDLIERVAVFLRSLNDESEVKAANAAGRRAKILIYGHSMAGAATSILLGHGKVFTEAGALGFDGKYIMPNATPTMLLAKTPV
eukprot:Gregarina_sp_Poly_1__860@NODE_1205_length_4786_cov_414_183725_g825_i0_p2_GENE_NODE_1205_length_4786_cov_414_183725_g825_i0NODE_1205_length_4786_cov_414_183725_g825_i0_p2_ORF_typecomplete_len320_score59_71His_Phos_1/PF00300_22/2_7e02His_Phos_1/PF00300_22/4_7e23Lipase_3/PF01764_25/0_15His_Phos_2/PF00328_22/0_24Hydrolase_4/PF12146_8/4_7e03Hydrolase_4/PF12146_8/0_31Chlorophyllase/PF07224_11/0_43DUF3106/PF11304_8/0_2DUF3106/PF11304_8/1_6e03Esterase/PF00756_20/2_4e03Esterase/PF00756_20/3_7e03Esterase/